MAAPGNPFAIGSGLGGGKGSGSGPLRPPGLPTPEARAAASEALPAVSGSPLPATPKRGRPTVPEVPPAVERFKITEQDITLGAGSVHLGGDDPDYASRPKTEAAVRELAAKTAEVAGHLHPRHGADGAHAHQDGQDGLVHASE